MKFYPKQIFHFIMNFGLITTFRILILPQFISDNEKRIHLKNYYIYKYLKSKFKHITKDYNDKIIKNSNPIDKSSPIWVCWWQGKENMPDLVRICYNSINNNSNGHPVHLITKSNYRQYVDIPSYIIQKQEEGYISLTFFSDVLRVFLLEKYGGIWIDSTVLVTAPIDFTKYGSFYSPKLEKKDNYFFSNYKWCAFILGAGKNNILFSFLKKVFEEYFKKKSILIDYFFIDCCIAIAYNNISEVKKLIDNVPYNNCKIYSLCEKLNEPFCKNEYNVILAQNIFHKLSWKINIFQEKNNKITYFGYLSKNNRND